MTDLHVLFVGPIFVPKNENSLKSMSIEATREKIVSVADRLFSRFGFQKTSIDEIVRTSRKAKGSLYYHFSSKEDLFKEVVLRELEGLKNKLAEMMSSNESTSAEKLSQYMMIRMDGMQEAVNYHETIKPDVFDHFDFLNDLRAGFDKWEKEMLKKIINEGVEKGELKIEMDTDVMSDMFVMIIKGLEIPFFLQNKYNNYKDHFKKMSHILLKGISP